MQAHALQLEVGFVENQAYVLHCTKTLTVSILARILIRCLDLANSGTAKFQLNAFEAMNVLMTTPNGWVYPCRTQDTLHLVLAARYIPAGD